MVLPPFFTNPFVDVDFVCVVLFCSDVIAASEGMFVIFTAQNIMLATEHLHQPLLFLLKEYRERNTMPLSLTMANSSMCAITIGLGFEQGDCLNLQNRSDRKSSSFHPLLPASHHISTPKFNT